MYVCKNNAIYIKPMLQHDASQLQAVKLQDVCTKFSKMKQF